MLTLRESIEKERPAMECYDRVHRELEEGKPWEEIDHGLKALRGKPISYEHWLNYFMARFKNRVRELLLISEHEPKE